jgi:hypothetical protein
MHRLFAGLSVLIFLPTTGAAPALKEETPYLPTTVGAKWSYQYRGYAEDPTGYEIVNVVTAITKRPGMRIVSIGQEMKGHETGAGIPTAESSKGLQGGYFSGEHFIGGVWKLKLPHNHGTEWREHRDGMNEPTRLEWYTARRSEQIEVPAGKFYAERVDRVCEELIDKKRGSSTSWYVRGIGLVKSVTSSGTSLVLNKFTPGTK